MDVTSDERWMRCALLAGRRAQGISYPNPPVGAALVHENELLAVGWTQAPGHEHAEAMCFRQCAAVPPNSTLYVNLEPCNHVGRTGRCTDLVINAGIGRVVVGLEDPNPLVAGAGISRLRDAGIEVAVGVLASNLREDMAEYLYRVGEGLTSGFLQQSGQRWDHAAQSWEQHRAGNRWTEEFIYRQSLREQLGDVSGLRILDFGGGSGEFSEFLHENGAIVTYVDHSAQMREIARHKTNGVLEAYCLTEDLEGSARPQLFDAVVANMVLHDVEDLGGTLGWLSSRLEMGGRLFVTILHPCFKPPVHGWSSLSESSARYMIDRYGNIGLNLTAVFGGGPSSIPTLNIHRRLSDYMAALLAIGLVLDSVFEPDGRWHPEYFASPLAVADDWFRRAPVLGFLAHKPQC